MQLLQYRSQDQPQGRTSSVRAAKTLTADVNTSVISASTVLAWLVTKWKSCQRAPGPHARISAFAAEQTTFQNHLDHDQLRRSIQISNGFNLTPKSNSKMLGMLNYTDKISLQKLATVVVLLQRSLLSYASFAITADGL